MDKANTSQLIPTNLNWFVGIGSMTKTDLKVTKIYRVRAGMSPVFKVHFSDGNQMQSNCRDEYIDSIYYKFMDKAINHYVYGEPIGATSHEDLYFH